MLVLTRVVQQEVVIDVPPSKEGTRIVVTLVACRDGDLTSPKRKARLGFEAPVEVRIMRRELLADEEG